MNYIDKIMNIIDGGEGFDLATTPAANAGNIITPISQSIDINDEDDRDIDTIVGQESFDLFNGSLERVNTKELDNSLSDYRADNLFSNESWKKIVSRDLFPEEVGNG